MEALRHMNWTCGLVCMRGSTILEYDMTAAGLSVLRERGLVSSKEGEELAALPKAERVVAVGMLCREDDNILNELERGTKQAVATFCHENGFTDEDIISVKRDAVYVLRPARILQVGKFLNFRESGKYSSFYNLSGIEMYYSCWTKSIVVKGLGKGIEVDHREYFLKFLRGIMDLAENLHSDRLLPILAQRRREYVTIKSTYECYKEMGPNNAYKLKNQIAGTALYVNDWPGDDNIDISFNYTKFLIPLISCLV
jgi:hypothetical protein